MVTDCVLQEWSKERSFSALASENRRGRGGVGLGMTGVSPTNATVRWEHRTLQMNDQVKIKVMEAETADEPEVSQAAPRGTRKYEKAYVRRMAKEFGWTIQTGGISGGRLC